MPTARLAAILLMVLIAAGATIALAYALASMGLPLWQAAIGPLLLVAILGVRWLGRRK